MENGEVPRPVEEGVSKQPWSTPSRVTLADLNEAQNGHVGGSDSGLPS